MSLSTSQHEWLRRVADYHSGGVSDAEHAAVEAHLATCQECQEALAMYRRFYSLLRSPLRLGPPSVHFDEETTVIGSAPSPYANTQPPKRSQRHRALGIVAAVVAATLVVVGFLAVYATGNGRPNPSATSTPAAFPTITPRPTATTESTVTATPDSTPQASAFVCANPPGSNLSYAYVRGDYQAYVVTGCAPPQKVPVATNYSMPLGWSSTNRYLAVMACDENNNCPVVLYDPTSGQTRATKYIGEYPLDASVGQTIRLFIGWLDDNTFLGALQPVISTDARNPLGPSTIVKVDVASGAETQVGKVAWFAGTKMFAPGYLFYAGLKTMSEGQAHLHRLDLSNGADTQLVPLGEYGNGGCQVSIFCNWTAPWDVSPDGTHVIYHSPAPTSFPSDVNVVKDTPLVYAGIDGTNPSKPFGSKLAPGLSAPEFSRDGAFLLASGIGQAQDPLAPQRFSLWRVDGSVMTVDGAFFAWRGDNQALILINNGTQTIFAFDLGSHTITPLESNSSFYVWAN